MIRVEIHYSQRVRELTSTPGETLYLDEGSRVRDLLSRLFARYPQLLALEKSLLIARNAEHTQAEQPLSDGDVVDVMPPLSAG